MSSRTLLSSKWSVLIPNTGWDSAEKNIWVPHYGELLSLKGRDIETNGEKEKESSHVSVHLPNAPTVGAGLG